MSGNPYEDHISGHLQGVAKEAARLLGDLKAGVVPCVVIRSVEGDEETKPVTGAQIRCWASQELRNCARHWRRPPPIELTELITHLLGADKPGKIGRPLSEETWAKFLAAVEHKAEHPEAMANDIARAINYPQRLHIRDWLKQDDFRKRVVIRRQQLREQRLQNLSRARQELMEQLESAPQKNDTRKN